MTESTKNTQIWICFWLFVNKLDGVGPVDNRPSTDKLHHFVRKKQQKNKTCDMWHVTCDMWHVTCDMWHVTCDMWHVTCDTWHLTYDTWHVTRDMWHMTHDNWHVTHDTWHVWVGEHSLKISAPALNVCDLWYYEDMEEKDDSLNELNNQWITRLFIEQPRLHRVW